MKSASGNKYFKIAAVFMTAFFLLSSVASADRGTRAIPKGNQPYAQTHYNRHHRHDCRGCIYHPRLVGFSFWFPPPVGLIVATLPFGYSRIIIAGQPYYYYAGIYYRRCPAGYLVVPDPHAASAETMVIYMK